MYMYIDPITSRKKVKRIPSHQLALLPAHFDTIPHPLGALHFWSHVEIKAGRSRHSRVSLASVKVNDISNLLAAAVHSPVMPIKWKRVAKPRSNTRFRG